jgi:regulator of protease activity HflC (stomatin/prohibitin superfamily)
MNVATVVQFLAGIAWLAFIGLVAVVVLRASRSRPVKGAVTLVLIALAVAIILSTVSSGLVFIQPEERGVVISALAPNGYREQALQPGLRWIIPFFENVITYPISRQTYTMSIAQSEGSIQGDDSITARTSDGQEIFVDASVIYAIDPTQVVQVHIDWQSRYTDELVRPLARGVIRDVVSQYGVEGVVSTKRAEMTALIATTMAKKLEDNGILLVDFILRNITFSPEYAASVEQKQIAEQQAQQAALTVEQRKQEAEQARQVAQGVADAVVIRAKGDADALIIDANAEAEARVIQAQAEKQALELISAILQNNPDLLLYQYITKLAPSIQTMLLPSDNPFLFPLPSFTPDAGSSYYTTPPPATPPPPPPPPPDRRFPQTPGGAGRPSDCQ